MRFLKDFDWRVPERLPVTLAWRAGTEATVRREAALAAIAAGAAVRLAPAGRP